MKKRSLKKRIIFISAIVVIIGALVYPTYKLVKYVKYVDSYGADTMEKAAQRYAEGGMRESDKVHYPYKIFKKLHRDLWIKYYEEGYVDPDVDGMEYYGYQRDIRNLTLSIEDISDEEKQQIIDSELSELIDNGIKIDEAYEVTIEGEMRKTYACDESLTGEGVYSDSNAKRDNWEKYESMGYLVYRVGHKWYIADVLSTL